MANIFLIDDDPRLLHDILVTYGHHVHLETNGVNALKTLLMSKGEWDLILLDIMMPGLDGWKVLQTVRDDEVMFDVPVIIVSTLNSEQTIVDGLKRGADGYITKPVTPKQLLASIEALMRRVQWAKTRGARQQNVLGQALEPATFKFLSLREREVLEYIVHGCSNQSIALNMSISEATVKSHLARIYKKLGVDNRTQAAFLIQKIGLV